MFYFFSRANVFVLNLRLQFWLKEKKKQLRPKNVTKTPPWKMHNKTKRKKMTHTLCRWCKSWFGMCKAFPNRMQMQHNRIFFLSCCCCRFFFSFSFCRPPPKQPSIADTKRIHLNKPFIWLLLNNLILFPCLLFFSVPPFFFSAHFVEYSYALPFAFTYIRSLCTTDVAVAAVAAVAVVFFCTLAYETEKKKQRWWWWWRRRRRWHRDAFIHLSLWTLVFVRYT